MSRATSRSDTMIFASGGRESASRSPVVRVMVTMGGVEAESICVIRPSVSPCEDPSSIFSRRSSSSSVTVTSIVLISKVEESYLPLMRCPSSRSEKVVTLPSMIILLAPVTVICAGRPMSGSTVMVFRKESRNTIKPDMLMAGGGRSRSSRSS